MHGGAASRGTGAVTPDVYWCDTASRDIGMGCASRGVDLGVGGVGCAGRRVIVRSGGVRCAAASASKGSASPINAATASSVAAITIIIAITVALASAEGSWGQQKALIGIREASVASRRPQLPRYQHILPAAHFAPSRAQVNSMDLLSSQLEPCMIMHV